MTAQGCSLPVRLLHLLDPEHAHELALRALAWGLYPCVHAVRDARLQVDCCGLHFPNPLGMAAGFDKNARALPALWSMGFGFVEVGTVTPLAQSGNPRPRLFRLSADEAIINRLGFNNEGQQTVHARLVRWQAWPRRGVLGVNIGANRHSRDRIADYVSGACRFADVADYLTINISSPNTPGLRNLQCAEELAALLAAVRAGLRERRQEGLPVFVKIAPDLDLQALEDIIEAALEHRVAGLVISNTTVERPATLRSRWRREQGGLSGRPLFDASTRMLAHARRLAGKRLKLIGCGGVHDAATAWEKIRAGADLVQLLSAFIYRGPRLVEDILAGLLERLEEAGHAHVSEAVGSGMEEWLQGKTMGGQSA